jgi:hypothetical protein
MKRAILVALLLAGSALTAAAETTHHVKHVAGPYGQEPGADARSTPAPSGPLACTALVLQVQDTDVGLNDGALAGLTLRVTPPHGNPFVTTVWKEVSMDQPPRRGGTIRVTCDPANPSDIHPVD